MDGINLLKQDHRAVEELFKKFDAAGDRAFKTKRKLADQVIRELSVHAAIEEQVLYPTAREVAPKAMDMVLESLEEHHIVKVVCSELEDMEPQDERFDAKVTVLKENVLHHAKEEERDLFPKMRKAMSKADLEELGARLEEAKKAAPTRPHPSAPDTPPGNLVAGPTAAVLDAGKEAVRGVREELRSE